MTSAGALSASFYGAVDVSTTTGPLSLTTGALGASVTALGPVVVSADAGGASGLEVRAGSSGVDVDAAGSIASLLGTSAGASSSPMTREQSHVGWSTTQTDAHGALMYLGWGVLIPGGVVVVLGGGAFGGGRLDLGLASCKGAGRPLRLRATLRRRTR